MNEMTIDRIAGVAVGAAVGDALGMPLEFGPAQPLERLVREMQAGRMPAGSFTDDTEMALALGESLLAERPLNPDDLARRFVAWYRTVPPDVGVHTARVLNWVDRGVIWHEASYGAWQSNQENAGNGSVMRCWPVALAFWQDQSQLVTASEMQSRVTHYHPESVAGSIFVNVMIAELIRGTSLKDALNLALTSGHLPAGLHQAVWAAGNRSRTSLINSGWVRHTLEAAVWGLSTTDSFEEAVVQVANLGKDADTAASVTGAMAGALYGLSAIPARWRAQLRGEWPRSSGNYWGEADFIRLAHSLAGV